MVHTVRLRREYNDSDDAPALCADAVELREEPSGSAASMYAPCAGSQSECRAYFTVARDGA